MHGTRRSGRSLRENSERPLGLTSSAQARHSLEQCSLLVDVAYARPHALEASELLTFGTCPLWSIYSVSARSATRKGSMPAYATAALRPMVVLRAVLPLLVRRWQPHMLSLYPCRAHAMACVV